MTDAREALAAHVDAIAAALPASAEELVTAPDLVDTLAHHLVNALEAAEEHARERITAGAGFTAVVDALRNAGLIDDDLREHALHLDALRRASTDGYTGIDVETLYSGAAEAIPALRRLLASLG